jgi:hypothetical protein
MASNIKDRFAYTGKGDGVTLDPNVNVVTRNDMISKETPLEIREAANKQPAKAPQVEKVPAAPKIIYGGDE